MFTRYRIFAVMAALIALLGFAFGPAGAEPAAAAGTTTAHVIRVSHSALVLDVEGGSTGDGARIIQWNQTFSANQLWIFDLVPGTSDTYYIRSASSGKVITISSSAPGANVVQWTNHNTPSQQWTEVSINGIAKFRNVATGLYLDVNNYSYSPGAPLVQWYQNNGLNQQFQVL